MPEQHRGRRRDDVGLEEVGRHAGAVADVVADVVGDDRRIARIVFRNARFDLTDEVGADVGGLREDTAAQTRKHRDQRAAEGEADEGRDRLRFVAVVDLQHDRVVAADREEAEADHEQTGDRAALEGEVECRPQAVTCRLGRAYVGAHGNQHADKAGCARQDRADGEPDRRFPAERLRSESDHDEEDCGDDGDRRVLTY